MIRLLAGLSIPLLLAACAASPNAPAADAPQTLRFEGRIEAVDDGCLADGVCALTIAGRKVVWMVGWSRDTWGTVSVERTVGAEVEVFCRTTADGCELRGDPGYYVRAKTR